MAWSRSGRRHGASAQSKMDAINRGMPGSYRTGGCSPAGTSGSNLASNFCLRDEERSWSESIRQSSRRLRQSGMRWYPRRQRQWGRPGPRLPRGTGRPRQIGVRDRNVGNVLHVATDKDEVPSDYSRSVLVAIGRLRTRTSSGSAKPITEARERLATARITSRRARLR